MRSSPQRLARLAAFLALIVAPVGGFLFSAPARGADGPAFTPTLAISPGLVSFPDHLTLNRAVGTTPAPVAHPAAAGDVVINEVVTDPQTDWSSNGFNGVPGSAAVGPADEFVELYIKVGGLDLAGWTIALNDTSPGMGDLTPLGAFQVSRYVGGGSFHATAAGAYLVLGSPRGSSMDNTIAIVLKDGQGTVINQVQIGAGGAPSGKSTGHDDEAVARTPNGVNTGDDSADFEKMAATPGRANVPGSLPPSPTIPPSATGTVATPTPAPTQTPTTTPMRSPTPGQPNHLAPGLGQPDTVAIGDFRNWPDGAWVSVSADVSVPPGIFSQRTIHIQDATGGVTVYLGRDNWPPLVVGQPILLTLGYIRHRGGEVQLYVRNGWHVHAGAGDVPVALEPWSVATGEVGQKNEGSLLVLSGRVTRLEAEAFWLDDGSGPARVFFAVTTGLGRPAVQVGEIWRVSGVVVANTTASASGPRYQLQPRYAADVAQMVGGQEIPYIAPVATAMATVTQEATAIVEP